MRTSIDTNIFSLLWSGDRDGQGIPERLDAARTQGALVLCPVVYAEMLANPIMSQPKLDAFLRETGILVDYDLAPEVWREAGMRFGIYSERRRRSGGGEAKRLLADYLVGAHALLQADRLLTFDTVRYRNDFPDLVLWGTERGV